MIASGGADNGGAIGKGWTGRDRERVATLAETFVPGTAERRADLAIAALETALPAGQVRQLRLAVRVMDSRSINAVLVRRRRRLAELSVEDRERLLRLWATSPLPLMRAGFQAWKRLLLFLAYADPADEQGRPNPLWPRLEYEPDTPPATAEPTPIQPLRPSIPLPAATWDLDADIAIVGSGAGGGVIAAELARAGRSVVVLEAGSFFAEPDMPTDELTAFDRLYLDHGLCASSDGSVAILAGATVGGGTTVNWTTSIPAPEEVRTEWAREHGLTGIDGAEAEADLDVLERELGLCPPAVVPPKDDAIIRGAHALGWEAAPTLRNAAACSQCGSCGFGCRLGAKQSGLRAHLAEAAQRGARVVPDALVTRVLIERGAAVGVEALVTVPVGSDRSATGAPDPRGSGSAAATAAAAPATGARPTSAAATPVPATATVRLTVHARQVVVAAGALRTPVVLARSGVSHEAVGRYLRLHPVSAIAARFEAPVETWRGPLQAARSLQFMGSGKRGRGFIVESAPVHPGLDALSFPWMSAAEHAEMMAAARYSAPLIAICRDRGSGMVRPASNGGGRIDYRVAAGDQETLRHGLVEMAKIARAAGAVHVAALGTPPASIELGCASEAGFEAFLDRLSRFDFSPNRGMVFSAHQMGSARMGANARGHACDPDGRVRADAGGAVIRNLYVGDSSLFPTAIGVNPMITVMLLARRVSRTVLAEG